MSKPYYMKLFDLTGKSAIVTGAIGFLGKQFCAVLAEYGANIIVVDLDSKKVDAFAKELMEQYGIKAKGIAADVSNPKMVQEMVNEAVEDFGEINILLNNAATKTSNINDFYTPFEEFTLEAWREIMAVNIDGMFLVAQAVGKQMLKQEKGGSIIQVSSIYGLLGPDKRIYKGSQFMGKEISSPAVYSASKAAVIGLSNYLATYWGDKQIRVNTLTPGGIESGQNNQFVKNYSDRVPLGRMGEPNDLIGAVIYLASDAAKYVTGQNLIIDGGLSAW